MFEGNSLLDLLDIEDKRLLDGHVTEKVLEKNHVILHPGDNTVFCYFPLGNAVASYFVVLQGGEMVETVIVGNEGAIGGLICDGHHPSFARACVMTRGSFYRIAADDLLQVRRQSESIHRLLSRYTDCLAAQMLQSIACNASHTIEQRAAKWLCAAVDRTQHNGISMTQEQLAALMGSGRSYASRVVQRFKRDALLQTRRGGLEVLDYDGLRERACTCNALVRDHFSRVLEVAA